ncbi:unnamed protein product, partial [Iphiclides podalirius]
MEGLTQNERIIWSCWEEKSPRDVVREAAAKGTHINLAIKYLMNKNSWSESSSRDWFLAEVKAWTIQLLIRKQIFKVLHILNKVNINPEDHLMTIAATSTEIEYRDFVVEQIDKNSKDIANGTFKQNKVFGEGSNRIFVNESELKALTIEKIENYPDHWKSLIATTLFFNTFEFTLLDFSSPHQMWNYLLEKNKAMILVRWINVQTSETSDRQSHVVPVYKTCQQIAKDDIDHYISSNPHLVLGMILLEDDAKLFDIFSKRDFLQFKDFKLPNKGYKHKLPHLYNVYKKFAGGNQMYDSKDVNVYQLLSGYRGLDVSKIFEFQLVNQSTKSLLSEKSDRRSLGSLLSSDVDVRGSIKALSHRTIDMPDFANEKLIKRYGYVAKLNHVYYLKQYRPCNASQALVAQQYQSYNRLQEKSIKSACCEAHALALQNWSDPAMAACAVSFVAMIGCNPTRCRVHMTAAKMMKHHYSVFKNMPEEKANKIVNEYMSKLIQSNEQAARDILQCLEEITMCKLKQMQETDGKVDIAVVLYESQTMVKFAILHNLPLPEMQIREFVRNNSWFNFLLFGDVFRYPLSQMLQLSQEFERQSYAEHLKYIMLHKNTEEEKDFKSVSNNGQRRYSRLNSMEVSPTQSSSFDFPSSAYMGRELWEVAAACHGPEDPPAALLRAADVCREPLLVLIASCYEPNAVDVLWAQWVLASIDPPESTREALQSRIAQRPLSEQFLRVAEVCLVEGYVGTLNESMLVFMPDSPLALLASFLYRCIRQRTFDVETSRILANFLQQCQRKYSSDSASAPWHMSKDTLQRIAVELVKVALSYSFDSAYHQREFLKCLADVQFERGLMVPTPNFVTLHEIIQISMQTSLVVSIQKLLQEDCESYLSDCIRIYTDNTKYDVALKIAKLAGLPVNDILKAEWSHKHQMLLSRDVEIEDKDLTLFIAESSEAFKKAAVTFYAATDFLLHYANGITDPIQKFYSYRIIMSWFEGNLEYGRRREEIEHSMWCVYFQVENQENVFLNSYQSILHFVLSGQKDRTLSKKVGQLNADRPFSATLHEIEVESDVGNIENVVTLEEPDAIDSWRRVVTQLLELRLLVEAFRLSALYKTPPEYRYRAPACPVQIVRTCLKLAEGTCSPYELPQELRLVISSPSSQNKLTVSDTSFEELVVIQERQDMQPVAVPQLAVREEADRLAALDALAVRSGLSLAKQIASYFRIALQIGWDYTSVLKYQNRPVDFINLVSGRSRMFLANLVFRTFNVPSKQVAEYLCLEMVAAIISPHLLKTSTFRQKEHFQYTLWGYALNSDIEMFLNMRPDACSHIGRLLLDHLVAFQRIYKAAGAFKTPENVLDDSCLDIETLIDEEYQNVDGAEVESVLTGDGTLVSAETESVYSVSTAYTAGNKMSRDSRRNLFDAASRSNVHVRYEVKSNVRKITQGAKLSTKQVNIISIELLVVAHECFSSACDTEGVAVSLRSGQALAARLLAARSWRLMVRLLTGLARYTECAYIFQALRDNHQFEFLLGQFDYMLGQQPDRIAEFKHGLLDFLKTHCPGDTDAYIMVALHFNMHAEAAAVKRKQALDLIDDLERIAADEARLSKRAAPAWVLVHDNVSTRTLLDTALDHCSDAAELYLQGGCTGSAGEMAALAQQVALQISLLNASPTRLILNRGTEQMYALVSEYLSFMEGLVLLAGRGGEAWRELAYRRALANDQAYLRDMAAYRPDVAHDFLNRYKTEKKKTTVSQAAMTELRNLIR